MKRKRSVRMITKLLILSLVLGLCLPSFTYQVKAYWEDESYSLNYSDTRAVAYQQKLGAATTSGKIQFSSNIATGTAKYIMLYGDNTKVNKDAGFLGGIDIPLQETENDYSNWLRKFSGFSFESSRLKWNFSEKAASDRLYIITDTNKERIPVYIIGANFQTDGGRRDTQVTQEAVADLNSSMDQLYSLIASIESQETAEIGKYYPEQEQMLKRVSCEVRNIISYKKDAT